MPSEIYFIGQVAAQRRAQAAAIIERANSLAGQAENMLIRINAIRTAIRADERGALVDTLTRSWHGLVDARNLTIRQWQDLTGRQWETHGDNLTRV